MTPRAYYNEIEPFAAEWLRNLIAAGHIASGEVDTRSITDVRAEDLKGFNQCHFFAGIGGWSYALRLAGWPDDRPVWTGSCPCQPFSVAGQGKGESDKRHLWPDFCRLISLAEPDVVFGEQVAGAGGRSWLAGVHTDLELFDYRFGFAELCAAGAGEKAWTRILGDDGGLDWEGDLVVGAPHIRQRLYWVADNAGAGPLSGAHAGIHRGEAGRGPWDVEPERHGDAGRMAHPGGGQREQRRRPVADEYEGAGWVPGSERDGATGGMAYSIGGGWHQPDGGPGEDLGAERTGPSSPAGQYSAVGFWDDFDILPFLDGKARRVESGSFPLAHGVSGRVGRLRGYGNAIVPQAAAEFIKAYLDVIRIESCRREQRRAAGEGSSLGVHDWFAEEFLAGQEGK